MKTILLTLFVGVIILIDTAYSQTAKIAPASGTVTPVVLNYNDLKPFNDGWAAFKRGNLWGFIDIQGKVVIEPVYTFEPYYRYGLIHVGIGIQRKAKIYNKEGNLVINSDPYYNLNGFTDSLYTTACTFGDPSKAIKPLRYLLNRKGEIAALLENENQSSGSTYCTQTPVERRIWFQDKMDYHKKGYLDLYGRIVIPAQFAEVKNFSNNRAWVKNKLPSGELRWGAIDTNGRVAIGFTYQFEQQPFKHYRCFVWDGAYAFMLIDTAGKVLSDIKFKQATPFNNNEVTTVKIEENYEDFSMIIDYYGKVIKKFEKPLPGSNKLQIYLKGGFNDGLAIATYGLFDKFGAVDKTGKVVIPFVFDLIKDFNNGRALAVKTEKTGIITTGVIDTHGNFVIVKMN
jgi:hypothetical protein